MKNSFKLLIFWGKFFLLSLMVFISANAAEAAPLPPPINDLAIIATPTGSQILAEIAASLDKRSKGLMFRKNLEPDRGMLFVFPEMGYWTFWMKNTLISLDIIWLDNSQNVLHVESHVPVCTKTDDSCPRYYSLRESRYVLEIQAGMAEKFGIKPGKRLQVSFPKNPPVP